MVILIDLLLRMLHCLVVLVSLGCSSLFLGVTFCWFSLCGCVSCCYSCCCCFYHASFCCWFWWFYVLLVCLLLCLFPCPLVSFCLCFFVFPFVPTCNCLGSLFFGYTKDLGGQNQRTPPKFVEHKDAREKQGEVSERRYMR